MGNPLFPGGSGSLASYILKQPKLDIYEDAEKKWRWRIWMSSDIVAASTQGYSTRVSCLENIKKVASHIIQLDKTGKIV